MSPFLEELGGAEDVNLEFGIERGGVIFLVPWDGDTENIGWEKVAVVVAGPICH